MTATKPINSGIAGGPQAEADGLIPVLQRQVGLYQRLLELSGQQGALVNEGTSQQLLELLGQRQRLIEELDKINSTLEPYRTDWAAIYGALPQDQRDIAAGLIDAAGKALSQIIEQDKKDGERLRGLKAQVGRQIGRVAQGNTAARAYRTAAGPDQNRFTNHQG